MSQFMYLLRACFFSSPGWSTVNAIVGGQALRSVALDSNLPKMPIEVAIVIIAILTFTFSFMGYVSP